MRKFAAAIGSALLLLPSPAGAVEKEHHVGLTLGPSVLVAEDKTLGGAGAGVTYSYGITDAFNLVAEAGSSLMATGGVDAKTPHSRPKTISSLAIGASYVLDVLRWVPYAGLLASSYTFGGGTLDRQLYGYGAQLALGLDYKFNFTWSAGVGYRQHLLLTAGRENPAIKPSTYPSYSTFFFRVEYAWGR